MAILVRLVIDRGPAVLALNGRPGSECNVKCWTRPGPLPDHLIEITPGKLAGTLELKIERPKRPGATRRKAETDEILRA